METHLLTVPLAMLPCLLWRELTQFSTLQGGILMTTATHLTSTLHLGQRLEHHSPQVRSSPLLASVIKVIWEHSMSICYSGRVE